MRRPAPRSVAPRRWKPPHRRARKGQIAWTRRGAAQRHALRDGRHLASLELGTGVPPLCVGTIRGCGRGWWWAMSQLVATSRDWCEFYELTDCLAGENARICGTSAARFREGSIGTGCHLLPGQHRRSVLRAPGTRSPRVCQARRPPHRGRLQMR
jgi:hypothetical protein